MKRISTNSIKRLLVLGVIAVAAVAPQAAKADPFFAPDGGFANITAACNHFYGVEVTTISTSGYHATHRLWALTYANGVYGQWELLYDWTTITGTTARYKPVRSTMSRWVQLYAEVAFLTPNGWQFGRGILNYANFSSELGGNQQWCWT